MGHVNVPFMVETAVMQRQQSLERGVVLGKRPQSSLFALVRLHLDTSRWVEERAWCSSIKGRTSSKGKLLNVPKEQSNLLPKRRHRKKMSIPKQGWLLSKPKDTGVPSRTFFLGEYLDGLSYFLLNMQKTMSAHIFFRMFSVLAINEVKAVWQ